MSLLRATLLRLALAVGLSMALWIFVSFSENPEERISFDAVPVEVRNSPPGLVLVDQRGLPNPSLSPVSVGVETDQATRDRLRQSDLRAFVDLSNLESGDRFVPVNVVPTRPDINFTVSELEPAAIQIRLEEIITKTTPITVSVQGDVPFSFVRGAPDVQANGAAVSEVRIYGPESRVSRVAQARAVADVEQRTANYVSPTQLEAIDTNGQRVDGVELEPRAVDVRIPISPLVGLKRVPVLGNVEGLPAPGYQIANIRSDPPLINLAGSSGTLDRVNQVGTAPVNIENARSVVTRTVALSLPPDTSRAEGEPSEVLVTVDIVPLSQPFQVQLPVQVQATNIRSGLLVSISPAQVQARLSGTSEALNQISANILVATVDVANLGPGTYQLTPQLALPNGISVVGEIPQVAVTLRASATATPAATAVPAPTETPTGPTPAPAGPTPPPAQETPRPVTSPPPATPEPAPPGITPTP